MSTVQMLIYASLVNVGKSNGFAMQVSLAVKQVSPAESPQRITAVLLDN